MCRLEQIIKYIVFLNISISEQIFCERYMYVGNIMIKQLKDYK